MLLHDWRYKQNKIDQFSESKNRKQNNPIEQSKIHKSSTPIPCLVAEKTDKAKEKKKSHPSEVDENECHLLWTKTNQSDHLLFFFWDKR